MVPKNKMVDFFGKLTLHVLCPTCGYDYAYVKEPRVDSRPGHDRAWPGRGECMRIAFEGECDHTWDLCFGFYKGETFMFVEPTHAA